MPDILHVAVAVIVNKNNEVCISLRHKDSYQGGLWEFPGGKVEENETVEQALTREIQEELELNIEESRPLITIKHDYEADDRSVILHVRKVLSFQGSARGVEGQEVKWVSISQLTNYDFPAANAVIIKSLQLPERYLITGQFSDDDDFLRKLSRALKNNIKLVQLRLKKDQVQNIRQQQLLIEKAVTLCAEVKAKLFLNVPTDFFSQLNLTQIYFDGFHLDSRRLNLLSNGEIQQSIQGKLLSASCHNQKELKQAIQLKADFVVLSPVQKTLSHPEMSAMGWDAFSSMIEDIAMPVYALGGLSEKDIEVAWSRGAQGVAAIGAFWE